MSAFVRNAADTGWAQAGLALAFNPSSSANLGAYSLSFGDVDLDGAMEAIMPNAQSGAVVADYTAGYPGSFGPAMNSSATYQVTSPYFDVGDGCRNIELVDVEGDGYQEVIMGCDFDTATVAGQGTLVVLPLRRSEGVWNNSTPTANEECATGTASGDVDGDGLDDLLMGCPADTSPAGGSAIVRVRSKFDKLAGEQRFGTYGPGVEEFQLAHPAGLAGDNCGSAIAAADVDGDGRDDAVLGCSGDDVGAVSNAGSIVVARRNATNDGFLAGTVHTNAVPTASWACGGAVARGSFDDDGFDDVAVRCDGVVLMYPGSASGLQAPSEVAVAGCGPTGGIATGDANGDGLDDVLVGCVSTNNSQLVLRRSDNTGFLAATVIAPGQAGFSGCGRSVAMGDVNRDGRDDIAIGCPTSFVSVYLPGIVDLQVRNVGNTGFVANYWFQPSDPTEMDSACGTSVELADINSDGSADVVFGCPGMDAGAVGSGSIEFWIRDAANTGWTAGHATLPRLHAWSPSTNMGCGTSLATGDGDGDGRVDILAGCPRSNVAATDSGAVYYFRNATAARFSTARTSRTRNLGRTLPARRILGVTTTWLEERNATASSTVEASTDGGTTWTVLTSGVAATLPPGLDPRLRITQPASAVFLLEPQRLHALSATWVVNEVPSSAPSSPAASAYVAAPSTATLQASYIDPEAQTGTVEFQVCSDAPCTAVVRPGTSASTASGATASWAITPSLSFGRYYWRVRGVDAPGDAGAWSATRIINVDNAPGTAVHVTPADGASSPTGTPTFTAQFVDADATDSGTITFQVCTDAGCATPVANGTSASGIAPGANGTWTPSTALAAGSYFWRVYGQDSLAATGVWSVTRTLTIGSPTLTVSVDSATAPLGTLAANTDAFVSTTVTATTNNITGYTLSATDENDTWGMNAAAGTIVDWTGTAATPTAWAAGTGPAFGITVRDAPGGRLAKWGPGTGTLQSDVTNNLYAGLDLTTSGVLHSRSTYSAAGDAIVVTSRATVPATQTAGTYAATVIFSIVANP